MYDGVLSIVESIAFTIAPDRSRYRVQSDHLNTAENEHSHSKPTYVHTKRS